MRGQECQFPQCALIPNSTDIHLRTSLQDTILDTLYLQVLVFQALVRSALNAIGAILMISFLNIIMADY